MFVLIGKLTEVSEIAKTFPADNAQDLYTETYTIGNDIGTTLRIVTGFQPSKWEHALNKTTIKYNIFLANIVTNL